MYVYDRRFAGRRFISMSRPEALEVLGFPPKSSPSAHEIQRVYKMMALEQHPDRGGNHDRMSELNVARDILEGRRPEDRTTFKHPQEDARAVAEKKRLSDLATLDKEANTVIDAGDVLLKGFDITRGRVSIEDFLLKDHERALESILHDIDQSADKNKDMLLAKSLVHTLTGMSVRLAKKFRVQDNVRGKLIADLLGFDPKAGLTWPSAVAHNKSISNFVTAFSEFKFESDKLNRLIQMSEDVPVSWDDLYYPLRSIIEAFHTDFTGAHKTIQFLLKDFEGKLRRGVQLSDNLEELYGIHNHIRLEQFQVPGDFAAVADGIRNVRL